MHNGLLEANTKVLKKSNLSLPLVYESLQLIGTFIVSPVVSAMIVEKTFTP